MLILSVYCMDNNPYGTSTGLENNDLKSACGFKCAREAIVVSPVLLSNQVNVCCTNEEKLRPS